MRVVSDTSPICYLLLIDRVDLLEALFQRVAIPSAVRAELAHPAAPRDLRTWIADPPPWLEIRSTFLHDPSLGRLHDGEREAILLAHEMQADLILLDEKRARTAARDRGLAVMGLLGVIAQADRNGLASPLEMVERLSRTHFRIDPRLLRTLLEDS